MSRNTIARTDARQNVCAFVGEFTLADFVGASNAIDIALPSNSVIVGGSVTVSTASDDTGTDVIDVGDSGTVDRYLDGANLKSAALSALVPTGAKVSTLRLTRIPQNGDGTVLTILVEFQYVTLGVAMGVQD